MSGATSDQCVLAVPPVNGTNDAPLPSSSSLSPPPEEKNDHPESVVPAKDIPDAAAVIASANTGCCESPVATGNRQNQTVGRLRTASAQVCALSPVSEISLNLQDASLGTPKGRKKTLSAPASNAGSAGGDGRLQGKVISTGFKSLLEAGDRNDDSNNNTDIGSTGSSNTTGQPQDTAQSTGCDSGGGGGGAIEPAEDLRRNDDDDNSRISTNFTLNSAGRSPATRAAEQSQRSVQRRLHIAPLRMLEAKLTGSPGKENLHTEEDLSFYQINSPQASPRPCSPCDCPEDSAELLPSEVTPNKQIVALLPGSTTGPGSATRVLRRPLEDYDPNSMDSGYGASMTSSGQSMFRFVQPSSVLPRQNSTSTTTSSPATTTSSSGGGVRLFHSLSSTGSMESMDDIDMDLFEMDTLDDDEEGGEAKLPSNLNSLICGAIKATKTTPENKRPFFRRCLSLSDNPVAQRAKHNLLFGSPKSPAAVVKTPERFRIAPDQENLTPFSSRTDSAAARCFKRPEPPGISPIQSKRHKPESTTTGTGANSLTPISAFRNTDNVSLDSPAHLTVPKRPILQKSISMNDAHIMSALSRSSTEPDLIGDFSKSYVLPLTDGRHRDLKSISAETMAELVRGTFDQQVASFHIIDCRYPYEFEGGHIRGAKNLYTQEQILEELIKIKTEPPRVEATADAPKRHIIVFHCEFSSERGPKLSRFLRNHDRILNSDSYPALHYPEIYLLHGGYKDFFAVHPDLCDPIAYRPMLDPDFGDAYRHFRAKSKSWNGADPVRGSSAAVLPSATNTSSTERGPPNRLVKSRSRLVL